MPDSFELLDGADAPRPLPADLRARLEEQLLAPDVARPLDPALDARLQHEMTDPVGDLLADLDAPRALSPALRAQLADALPRRRRPVWALAGAASVAAAVAVALVLNQHSPSGSITAVGPTASPVPTPTLAAGGGGAAGGTTGGGTTGATGAVSVPSSAPGSVRAPTPAAAAPLPVAAAQGGPAAGSAPRALASVAPNSGPLRGGTRVRLRGSGLESVTQVLFGRTSGTHLVVDADGSVLITTPAVSSPRSVAVTVTFAHGPSSTLGRGFSYVAVPELTGISPSSGAAGTWVTLTGRALTDTRQVLFDGTAATKVVQDSTGQVRALAPSHAIGPVDVTVTTAGGTSNAEQYLYLAR